MRLLFCRAARSIYGVIHEKCWVFFANMPFHVQGPSSLQTTVLRPHTSSPKSTYNQLSQPKRRSLSNFPYPYQDPLLPLQYLTHLLHHSPSPVTKPRMEHSLSSRMLPPHRRLERTIYSIHSSLLRELLFLPLSSLPLRQRPHHQHPLITLVTRGSRRSQSRRIWNLTS